MTTRRDAITAMVGAGVVASLPMQGKAAALAATPGGRYRIGPIMQYGYVVKDVEKSAMEWVRKIGIGPFYIFDQPIDNYVFRGKPTKLSMRTAVTYWQGLQMELIQQTSSDETFYSESLRKAPGKLNHVGVTVTDIDAAVASLDAAKYVVHCGGTTGGLTFAYLENYLPDGLTLELMAAPPENFPAFEGMKAIAQSWDGSTKPLRTMQDLIADLGALAKSAPAR